jgi:general secretion pathway protein G
MATKVQMQQIEDAISAYRTKNGELPPALTDLVGEFIDSNRVPRDAWDNPYDYIRGDDGNTYELISYGADGVEGGEGEDADIRLE